MSLVSFSYKVGMQPVISKFVKWVLKCAELACAGAQKKA
jgi:hypothetical protein